MAGDVADHPQSTGRPATNHPLAPGVGTVEMQSLVPGAGAPPGISDSGGLGRRGREGLQTSLSLGNFSCHSCAERLGATAATLPGAGSASADGDHTRTRVSPEPDAE